MQRSLSRLIVGLGLVGGAVMGRCLATAHGAPVLTFGPHLPALMRIDFVTGPIALLGVGVVASTPDLARSRRFLGLLVLIAAIAWPALKLPDMGAVLFTISRRHGVHSHDLVVFPAFAAALALLAPWRAPLLRPAVRSAHRPLAGRLVPTPQH